MIPQMELPAEILRLVARYLHDHLMTPRAISLTRIIIAESLRDPHFGRGFCEDHVKHMNDLAEIFQEWNDSGKAQFDDPLAAAKLFNAMIFSDAQRSEEHTSELQSLMRISYAVFCLKKKNLYSPALTVKTDTQYKHVHYIERCTHSHAYTNP